MKQILLLMSLALFLCLPAFGYVDGTNCTAIYHVPLGQPYNTKITRPPFWETNRWDCLSGGLSHTEFEGSPGDGVITEFELALRFDTSNGVVFYPAPYTDPNLVHISMTYQNYVTELTGYTITQGTGRVVLASPPPLYAEVFFTIDAP